MSLFLKDKKRILEAGCGLARDSKMFAEMNPTVSKPLENTYELPRCEKGVQLSAPYQGHPTTEIGIIGDRNNIPPGGTRKLKI